jgi:hypothetical protein
MCILYIRRECIRPINSLLISPHCIASGTDTVTVICNIHIYKIQISFLGIRIIFLLIAFAYYYNY